MKLVFRLSMVAAAFSVAVAVAGCSVQATTESVSPVASPQVTASSTGAPSAKSLPSPTGDPRDQEKHKVVLSGQGIGDFRFGARQAEVVSYLSGLGKPDEINKRIRCEIDGTGTWAEYYVYGDLSVEFHSKGSAKSKPRTLASWELSPGKRAENVIISGELPIGLSLAELKAKYLGEAFYYGEVLDFWKFTMPDGLYVTGSANKLDQIGAGYFSTCE